MAGMHTYYIDILTYMYVSYVFRIPIWWPDVTGYLFSIIIPESPNISHVYI